MRRALIESDRLVLNLNGGVHRLRGSLVFTAGGGVSLTMWLTVHGRTARNGAIRRPLHTSCPTRSGDLATHASQLCDLRGARVLQAVSEHAFRDAELLGEVPRAEL